MTASHADDAPARLTHTDDAGQARMVDVGAKSATKRIAIAGGTIRMSAQAFAAIRDNTISKGDVLGTARLAGIMAAKQTSNLIPLCHPIALSHVGIVLSLDETLPGVRVEAEASATSNTGVEMEAIVAATIALATIYDMAKSADRAMVIEDVRLLRKSGGKSGDYTAST